MPKSFVQLEEGKVAYLAGGKGKNLILLHSLNISSDSWEKVFSPLGQNYAVYALDMPGHGDSEKPAKNFLIEDYTRIVVQFMERMKIEKAIVCGNSVGALIAVEMGAAYPQKVEKLILVGCPARDAWERMERFAFSALSFDVQGNPSPLSLTDLKMTFAHPTPELAGWFNQLRSKAGVWVKKTMIAISLYDPFPQFARIKCPTLILFGDQDVLREKEKAILQGIKGSQSVILADAGHVPQIDQPQAFLLEVERFLGSLL
ncbi:MAG: alpha/beta hydrolase [Deltaproteobacteria bacterium]|nr:alpha/beta hydrolase [Deltaproteobacteria bacterium]